MSPADLHIGDQATLTGTVRTISQIAPEGHLRITIDVAPLMHAAMFRDGLPGTLCRPGWEPMVTAVTDKVTCPACRQRIDGGPVRGVTS